jgi:uncharacterized Zn-binding protein involved in type VI secretion
MAELNIATDGDPNTHGLGNLEANPLQTKVYVGGARVCLGPPSTGVQSIARLVPPGWATGGVAVGDFASPDSDCDDDHPPTHCFPYATQGSSQVFIKGIGVHRGGDGRWCGATTVAKNGKVFAG